MVRWTVYSRVDCSLCEELLLELQTLIGPAAMQQVQVLDVDADPVTQQRYGARVPVLLADDEFVCAYRLDAERVRAYLGD